MVNAARCISCSFLIGAIAGVSPFVFLEILPTLLDPSQAVVEPNYKAIAVTGFLVGAACAIMFTKTFDQREPQDIFLYALGIPAILIATVSNLGTKYDAARKVTATQVAASTAIFSPGPPPVGDVPLTEVTPSAPPAQGGSLLFPGWAWAENSARDNGGRREVLPMFVQVDGYLVVIGRYSNEADAVRGLDELRRQHLKTEVYIPKVLKIFRANPATYYVTYSEPLSKDDATKLYRLLLINDPQLSPAIVRQKGR